MRHSILLLLLGAPAGAARAETLADAFVMRKSGETLLSFVQMC